MDTKDKSTVKSVPILLMVGAPPPAEGSLVISYERYNMNVKVRLQCIMSNLR